MRSGSSKFAAMPSPNRNPAKKLVDGGDFADVVLHNRASIIEMIKTIDAGGTLQL
jgi:hypothetical protein